MKDTYTYIEVYEDGTIDLTEYWRGNVTTELYFDSWAEVFTSYGDFSNYPLHVNTNAFRSECIKSDGTIR